MLANVACLALALIAAFVAASLLWRLVSRRWPLPCPHWLSWVLSSRLSEKTGITRITLQRIGLRPGEQCLDIGSGPGRLTLPAAHRVGPTGTIVALDVQPQMLARLRERAEKAGITNILYRLGDITTDDGLPSNHFDRAWLVTVLGEVPDRPAALRNTFRVLKPGGTLSITEVFPDPHYQRRSTVLRLCQEAGFDPTEHWGTAFTFTQNFVKSRNQR